MVVKNPIKFTGLGNYRAKEKRIYLSIERDATINDERGSRLRT